MCSTWGTAEGKWFYDCEPDAVNMPNNPKTNRLQSIEPNLTDAERLEQDLKEQYDAQIAPLNLTTVFLNFDMTSASFNAKKSFISSRGRFQAVNFN